MEIIAKKLTPQADEMAEINRFTSRELTADEVYTFSVILCDNEVDRDFERFDGAALESLAGLFVGKTGVFDHDVSGKNQTARIYHTEVITDDSRKTSQGEPYCAVKAQAYMVKCASNNDLMLEIDGGIKKEVSVSCSVSMAQCSICGANRRAGACNHKGGRSYDSKLCYHTLSKVTDAYEWSFVAVPAQKNAGVTKGFTAKEVNNMTLTDLDALTKAFDGCDDDGITISCEDARQLNEQICALHKAAELGEQYRSELISEVKRLCFLSNEGIPSEIIGSVASKMDIAELKAFKQSYEAKQGGIVQLRGDKADGNGETANFKL